MENTKEENLDTRGGLFTFWLLLLVRESSDFGTVTRPENDQIYAILLKVREIWNKKKKKN